MELAITEKNFTLPACVANFDEIKSEISAKQNFYSTLVITENDVKQAKKERAYLNGLRKAIDEERKKIKKEYMTPYLEIEDKFTTLTDMLKNSIEAIDGQLQAIENKALQAKYNDLVECFHSVNTLEFIAPEDVISTNWRNKTQKSGKIKEEIREKIFKINSDFSYLESMYSNSELWRAIFRKFTETKSREETLAYAVELERTETHGNAPVSNANESNVITLHGGQECVKTLTGAFRVECTPEQLKALKYFMEKTGIRFKVIKEEELW